MQWIRASSDMPGCMRIAALVVLQLFLVACARDSTGAFDILRESTAVANGDVASSEVRAPQPTPVSAVSCGMEATCAVVGGEVWCWGGAWDCMPDPSTAVPKRVAGLADIVDVDVGYSYACAIGINGEVWCWELREPVDTGDGDSDVGRWIPDQIVGPHGVVSVRAGGSGTACAIDSKGAVWCWGTFGSVFCPDEPSWELLQPEVVVLPEAARDLALGHASACAVTFSGEVWCWGFALVPEDGMGDGLAPFVLQSLGPADQVALGLGICAARSSGEVLCQGAPQDPTAEGAWFVPMDTDVELVELDAFLSDVCVRYADGQSACWSSFETPPVDAEDGWPVSVSQLSTGAYHRCAIGTAGQLLCSGDNEKGELGVGEAAMATKLTKTDHYLSAGPRSFSTATPMSCEVSGAGELRCWGAVEKPSPGHGHVPGTEPIVLPCPEPGQHWAAVAAGGEGQDWDALEQRACGMTTSGAVLCGFFDIGVVPEQIEWREVVMPGSTAAVVNGGGLLNCALLDDGSLACWLNPDANEESVELTADPIPGAGTGYTALSCTAGNCLATGAAAGTVQFRYWGPEWEVEHFPGIYGTSVAAGEASACVLTVAQEVVCWGLNQECECGIEWQPGNAQSVDEPTAVQLPGKAMEIAEGQFFTCASLENGDVACWGMPEEACDYLQGGEPPLCEPVVVGSVGAIPDVFVASRNHLLVGVSPGDLWFLGVNNVGEIPGGPLPFSEEPVEVVLPLPAE